MKKIGIIVVAILVLFCIAIEFLNFSAINERFNVIQSEIALRDNELLSSFKSLKEELLKNTVAPKINHDSVLIIAPIKKRVKKKLDTVVVVDQYKSWKDSISLLHDAMGRLQDYIVLTKTQGEQTTALQVATEKQQSARTLQNYIDSLHDARIAELRKQDYLFKAVTKNGINLILLQSKTVDKYHYLLYSIENEGKIPFTPNTKFAINPIKNSEAVESIPPDQKRVCWAIFEGKNSSITLENIPLILLVK